MKSKKILAVLIAVIMCAAAFAGCSGNSVTNKNGAVTLTDMKGREIALNGPATRVVAITASDCEILYAIGAGEALVGRGAYCDYPDKILSVPIVESGANMNVEQVMDLTPQVVFMSAMAQSVEHVQALEAAGAKVIVSDAQDIAGVYTAIELIGAVVGKETEAKALIESMKSSFAGIEGKTENNGKTVYFEVSPLEYGLWTAGSGTFMDELASILGLSNAFADVEGWGAISEEQVIERDPDYIVTIAMYFGEGPEPVDEILGRNGWENMKAIQNRTVYNADGNETARPGPRLVDAAEKLYEFIY